jgi:hypothetical protein
LLVRAPIISIARVTICASAVYSDAADGAAIDAVEGAVGAERGFSREDIGGSAIVRRLAVIARIPSLAGA